MSIPFQRLISTLEPLETEETREPRKVFGATERLVVAFACVTTHHHHHHRSVFHSCTHASLFIHPRLSRLSRSLAPPPPSPFLPDRPHVPITPPHRHLPRATPPRDAPRAIDARTTRNPSHRSPSSHPSTHPRVARSTSSLPSPIARHPPRGVAGASGRIMMRSIRLVGVARETSRALTTRTYPDIFFSRILLLVVASSSSRTHLDRASRLRRNSRHGGWSRRPGCDDDDADDDGGWMAWTETDGCVFYFIFYL